MQATQAVRRHAVSVWLSNRFVYAKCLDPQSGEALVELSSKDLAKGTLADKMNKADVAAAEATAAEFATRLKQHGIDTARLESRVRYHGRYKAFVDRLRASGITI